jgi:hypothetical protein
VSTRETRLEFLTWIATFATVAGVVVAALPLLARTAFSPSSLSARTSAAGLAIVGLGLFLTRMVRRMGQPDLLLIEATKLLTIHDKAGRNAGMLRRHTYLATRDVASWVFALSMRADGRIADLCINGDPVNPSEIDVVLGSTHLQRVFLEPLKKGHRVTAELTYTLHDSFVGPRQRSIMGVSMSPQRIAIGIQLPADRPSIDAVGFLAYHDQPEEELSGVVVADNGHSIHFECDHPRRGAQYQVVWRW